MPYFSEIVCFTLLGCILFVLVLGMLDFEYPESDLFAGIVGFSIREIAQCLNNHYNKPQGNGNGTD